MNYISYRDLGQNGRLGNQLFQIAATLSTAKKYNAIALFPQWEYQKYFAPIGSPLTVEPNYHYREPAFHYTEIDWNDADCINNSQSENKVLNLHGYFQSEKYFDSCKRLILSAFEPNKDFLNKLKATAIYSKAPSNSVTCSIHVRRGDYVNNDFYAQLGFNYYKQALICVNEIAYHRGVTISKFVVFSDDIDYCRNIFKGDEFLFISGADIEDLFLMSYCDYNICANSSFSWWAHYLNQNNGKIGIFPKQWFGENTTLNTKDLYTEKMILI
mgnify:FL=1